MLFNKIFYKVNRRLADNYGTRRGALLACKHRLLCFFGVYREYRQINWNSIERLVFVCKGNICRSAYAEAVVKTLGVDVISCGIDTVLGSPANEVAIKAAATRGFDLCNHKTTTFQSLALKQSDLLVAMEPTQLRYLQQSLGRKNTLTLLGLWGKPLSPHINDPYGASGKYFDNCFNYIEKSVHGITQKIRKAKKT